MGRRRICGGLFEKGALLLLSLRIARRKRIFEWDWETMRNRSLIITNVLDLDRVPSKYGDLMLVAKFFGKNVNRMVNNAIVKKKLN